MMAEVSVRVSAEVPASCHSVYDFLIDANNHTMFTDILAIEMLTETTREPGMRWREIRKMGKREATMEFELTTCRHGESFTVQCEEGGVTWVSEHIFDSSLLGSLVTIECRWKPKGLMMRLMTPLIRRHLNKGISRDISQLVHIFS